MKSEPHSWAWEQSSSQLEQVFIPCRRIQETVEEAWVHIWSFYNLPSLSSVFQFADAEILNDIEDSCAMLRPTSASR
jgi:hypothetical protein